MADYAYPDPAVQVADAQELARDLVVIPNRGVQLVPNIGIIGGTHSVLVIETGIGPRNAERVLEFAADYARQFSRRTVVLVVGDARTNYADPAAASLADVSDRVGKLYWLNPEPRRYWDQGDSVMSKYAPHCAQVRECSTLRQIADFVQSLAS